MTAGGLDAGRTAAGVTAAGVGAAVGIGNDIDAGMGAGEVMIGIAAGPVAAGPATGATAGPATGPTAPGNVIGAAGMITGTTGTGAYLTSQAAASARY